MTTPGYYPVVLPPDIEWLAQAFHTPRLAALEGFSQPVPVVTKLPPPQNLSATLTGILRIEAGDVRPIEFGAAYDCDYLMHAYSPDEIQASQISRTAIANACAAGGLKVVGWYIVRLENFMGGRRLKDPEVPENIVRYRSAVTWRVEGQILT